MVAPMLAKPGTTVKEVAIMLVRWVLRVTLRLVLRLAVVAVILAVVRAVVGWLAGDPGVPAGPGANGSAAGTNGSAGGARRSGKGGGVPMSFDSWPAVPQAPARSEGPPGVTPT